VKNGFDSEQEQLLYLFCCFISLFIFLIIFSRSSICEKYNNVCYRAFIVNYLLTLFSSLVRAFKIIGHTGSCTGCGMFIFFYFLFYFTLILLILQVFSSFFFRSSIRYGHCMGYSLLFFLFFAYFNF